MKILNEIITLPLQNFVVMEPVDFLIVCKCHLFCHDGKTCKNGAKDLK